MAKYSKNKKNVQQTRKKPVRTATKTLKKKKEAIDLFAKIETFFSSHEKTIFWLAIVLSSLFSLVLFDLKVSRGGDDAAYIVRAYNFVHDFTFPDYQGPLYPMLLGVFVWIFGIKIPLLKFISVFFAVGQFVYIFKAYKKNIPYGFLVPTLLLAASNAYVLYYASQTYTEALFMFLQAVFLYFVIRNFLSNEKLSDSLKDNYKLFLGLGLIIFLMGITKSMGYGSFFVVILLFAFYQKWRYILYTIGGFAVFVGAFEAIKKILWQKAGVQFSAQAAQLFQKNPYYPERGMEDFFGFVQRFWDNSQIYLSKYFFNYLGFRNDVSEVSQALTFLAFALFALSLYWAFRKDRFMFFTGIYVAVMYSIMFIILQKIWDSSRLTIPYFIPVMLFVFSGFYYFFTAKNRKKFQFVFVILVLIVFGFNLKRLKEKVATQFPVIKENLKSDKYYGFTPDWVHYLQMAEWVGKNIPKDKIVAARKPNLAQIYGNRKFRGIYRVPTKNPDTLIGMLKKQNIEYVIMASLRKYELKKTEYVINTIQRYLYYIQQKYPQSLQQIHYIGQDEPAYLFQIQYPDSIITTP